MRDSGWNRSALRSLLVSFCVMGAGASVAHAASPHEIARGAYLVSIGICDSCHTPKDAEGRSIKEMHLAGGHRVGGLLSSNLTPDPDTGLGKWSDEQIIASIRNGVRADGAPVRPPMGVFFYRNISDEDIHAIVAYLRTVPPVKNAVERAPARGPSPVYEPVTAVGSPDVKDQIRHGRYLGETIAHCVQCHTPRINGSPDTARYGAGGNTYTARGGGTVLAPNITPTRLASWSDDQIKAAITKGVRPDGGQLAAVMDFDLYARMTEADLSALVAYLRSLERHPEP